MRFVTIFPELKSFHLKKDVGLIPILLKKFNGYDSKIVCYKNEEHYEFDNNSIDIEFIKKENGDKKDFAKYIMKNAKNIDVLNLYHVTSNRNFTWALIYKILNPKGKVFLKLDADHNIKIYDYNKNSYKQKLKNKVLNKIDVITVENFTIKNYIEQEWGLDVKFMPNGFYDDGIRNTTFNEKENIILTVGRIGAKQKATEVLLEAFAKCHEEIEGWKLVVVGGVEKEFESYIEEYKKKYPQLEEKVEFAGMIDDYEKLRKYYRKSKVFCLPSRYESFGLVLVEALMEGCYIVTSNHEAADTIVRNEEVGAIFNVDDVEGLQHTLTECCNNVKFNESKYEKISSYAYENFYWPDILNTLDKYLKE